MEQRLDLLKVLQRDYRTPEDAAGLISRTIPGLAFYWMVLNHVLAASRKANNGSFTSEDYYRHGLGIFRSVERAGGQVEISGVYRVLSVPGPYVYVANHMSVLETFVLSAMLHPIGDHTFIVKQSLVDYPVFRHVIMAIDPIVVGRTNPREDLEIVLRQGTEKLKNGVSVVVFPQHTRTTEFVPAKFNTLGIKLAKRAGAAVAPIALKTDFWGNGRLIKDFGRISPKKKVRFCFGTPLKISGNGHEEHSQILQFIGERLAQWQQAD